MHFFLPNLKENRYSFRVRGTLLLDHLDVTHGYISDKADIKHNDSRLFIFGKAFDQNRKHPQLNIKKKVIEGRKPSYLPYLVVNKTC